MPTPSRRPEPEVLEAEPAISADLCVVSKSMNSKGRVPSGCVDDAADDARPRRRGAPPPAGTERTGCRSHGLLHRNVEVDVTPTRRRGTPSPARARAASTECAQTAGGPIVPVGGVGVGVHDATPWRHAGGAPPGLLGHLPTTAHATRAAFLHPVAAAPTITHHALNSLRSGRRAVG